VGRLLAALACATALVAVGPTAAAADTSPVVRADDVHDWAAYKRPDVLQAIVVHMVGAELAAGDNNEILSGLAAQVWASQASAAGMRVGQKPAAHSLMVFQPGVLNAGDQRHVAYVERVERNGKIRISEMNAPNLYVVSYRTLRASAARLPGVEFIY
jgi:hypothetical protein